MAQNCLCQITFNYNFKNLPFELKKIIVSYINIKKLISYNDKEVDPCINYYINKYIETSLLTNASIFTFLRRTFLYSSIINFKIRKMATLYAADFIQHSNLIDEKTDTKYANKHVYFNIKYNHVTDNLSNSSHEMSSIRNYRINNKVTILRGNTVCDIIMTEEYIIHEIIDSLCHFMDNFKGIYQVHSIELIGTKYPMFINYPDINDSNTSRHHIIKKYY